MFSSLFRETPNKMLRVFAATLRSGRGAAAANQLQQKRFLNIHEYQVRWQTEEKTDTNPADSDRSDRSLAHSSPPAAKPTSLSPPHHPPKTINRAPR